MPFTIEQLDSYFTRMADTNWNKYVSEPNLTYAREFLTGQLQTLPSFIPTYFNEKFAYLAELLLKNETSDDKKDLLIALFNEPEVQMSATHEITRTLLQGMGKDDLVLKFEQRKNIILRLGWTEKKLGLYLMAHFGFYFDRAEMIKNEDACCQLINKTYRDLSGPEIDSLIAYNKSDRWHKSLATVLSLYHNEKCLAYLKNYEKPEGELDMSVMRFRLEFYPENFTTYYLDEIRSLPELVSSSLATKFSAFLHYNDVVTIESELCGYARRYLQLYLESYATYYEGNFKSRTYLLDISKYDYIYMDLSGWALFFLLRNDEKAATTFIDRISNSDVILNHQVLHMLFRQGNEKYIPLLTSQVYKKARSSYQDKDRAESAISIFKGAKNELVFDGLWQFDKYKSVAAKKAAMQLLVEEDPGVLQKAIQGLTGINAEIRICCARILAQLSSPAALEALKNSIDTEKDDDARDVMLSVAGQEYIDTIDENTAISIIDKTKKRGKLKKGIINWLNESDLPPLYYLSGKQLSADEVRFIIYRMSRCKEMRSDIEIKPILNSIDKSRSGDFAKKIISLYKEKSFEAKFKYLLALAAILGDEDVINLFTKGIDDWIEKNRKAQAEFGVKALALQGSNKALRWIEWYSRKYKSKKPYIGEAALLALESAAEELNITIHELGDRVVPDFGFHGLFKHFTVEGDEYRAFIDSNFKLAFFNENNKKIKAVPAAADSALKDEFKTIIKEVRDIVKSQSSRLEYYLIIQRRWTNEQWSKFFLQNPVMFIYATKLLWGVYDEKGQLKGQFICSEDTSLVNEDNDEIVIPEASYVGIVHPTQLTTGQLQKWKQQFYDLSIDPIFPQLDRKLPDMDGIDLSKAIILKYLGKQMAPGSIKSTLERNGWHKGPTGDGGMIESFNLLYFEKKMEALLELEGVGAGYGWGTEEKLGRLYIVDKSKVTQRWFNHPQHDTDERLVKLKDVPVIFLNEMLAAIDSIKPVEK